MGLRRFFRRRREDAELARELEAHIAHEVDENVASGMSEDVARRQAYLKLGSPRRVREDVWEWNTMGFLDSVLRDLRYAVRALWRNPGFSIVSVLCLTLGIGANAAVFSWIEGVLLRPFPLVAHQERMVAISGTEPHGVDKGALGCCYTDVSWPDFQDFQTNCKLMDWLIVDRITGTTLSIGNRAERVTGSVVSSNYFDALGIHPILGRGFEPAEDTGRNAHPVTVISYWLWKERFKGDPAIVGKAQLLNGVPHTIVGVAPEGFYGTFVGYPMQFWVPVSMQEVFDPGGYKLDDRGETWIEGFARLKPGVTMEQAQAEISGVAKRLESDYLATNRGRGVKLFPLWKTPFNRAGALAPTLEIALAVVFFVLLIACANVSSLLLVRSLARRHEITVRLAIGAKRGRLLRQLLTEGLVLSVLAAAGGLAVAYLCRNLLVVFFPLSSVMATNLAGAMDWRVLVFSLGICLISTLMFGLVPALQTSKVDLAGALKSESGTSFGGRGKSRIRSALVLFQVSLSFILLVGGSLLMQSLRRIRTADPGFSADKVMVTGFDLVSAGYDATRAKSFQDGLVDRVQALSGVESAALARIPPFSFASYFSAPVTVDGYQSAPNERPTEEYNQVGPGYFATMGIPVVSGREFTRADNDTTFPAVVVNEQMVAKYWHGQDPVGKRMQVRDRWMQVIGVARNSTYATFAEETEPFFYVSLGQLGRSFAVRTNLMIRTSRSPGTMATALAHEVRSLDAGLGLSEVITLREYMNRSALASQQIVVALLSIFGGIALLLAAIGLYGVMSYAVSQSTREFGLRIALGATPSDLLRLVMSHGLTLTVGGVVLGSVAALALTRLIVGDLLYKVNPRDPLAFGLAFAVMTIASLAACFLPAWRATRIDPVRALRD
jgi:macrolide transport system ATP-binding/permease protein